MLDIEGIISWILFWILFIFEFTPTGQSCKSTSGCVDRVLKTQKYQATLSVYNSLVCVKHVILSLHVYLMTSVGPCMALFQSMSPPATKILLYFPVRVLQISIFWYVPTMQMFVTGQKVNGKTLQEYSPVKLFSTIFSMWTV